MTEKEAILRDLKVIAILDQKIDYSDHDNIGAVLALNPKSLFSTEYGERYLERVRKMYNGEDYDHTCILCGAPLEDAGPICRNCYKMITIGNAKKPEIPKPVSTTTEEEPSAAEEAVVTEEAAVEEESATVEEAQPAEAETPVEETASSEEETPVEEAQPAEAEAPTEELSQPEDEAPVEENTQPEEEPSVEDETPETEAPVEENTSIEEERKEEVAEEFDEDAKEMNQTYEEINPDAVDPKAKQIHYWRAFVLLFSIVCFSIGIVCGLILLIKSAGNATHAVGSADTVIQTQLETESPLLKKVDNEVVL